MLITHIGILTAASCLLKNAENEKFYFANELKVALGTVDLMDSTARTVEYFEVKSVKTHGRFNVKTLINNLALLKVC